VTTTAAQAVAAITKGMANNKIVLDTERMGMPIQVTLVVEGTDLAAELSKIVKVSDTEYEVPKSVIAAAIANPMAMTKGARVVPAMKNGKAAGIKLYAIRPSSAYARVGLANGDTIVAINGVALTSMEKALDLFSGLSTAKAITIDLERGGKPVAIKIKIKIK
jgi:type II secretion system protein C